jgi:hypothetical protein
MKGPRMLGLSRCLKCLGMGILAVCSIPATASEAGIDIELNKMEPHEKDCRAYFVINNKSDKSYDTLKLDLVLFRSDGVIGQRFAVELAPIKPKKRTVKLFDISDTACDQVGSFLINEVIECKAAAGDVSDCLQELSVSSRTDVELAK